MLFVRQLPKATKLELYKQIKGLCLWEGLPIAETISEALDNKARDVLPLVDYDMCINYMEVYKDYSYGRF